MLRLAVKKTSSDMFCVRNYFLLKIGFFLPSLASDGIPQSQALGGDGENRTPVQI
jgi:hypothetical protein